MSRERREISQGEWAEIRAHLAEEDDGLDGLADLATVEVAATVDDLLRLAAGLDHGPRAGC